MTDILSFSVLLCVGVVILGFFFIAAVGRERERLIGERDCLREDVRDLLSRLRRRDVEIQQLRQALEQSGKIVWLKKAR